MRCAVERKDWLLLALGAPEPDGSQPLALDRVRIMKCLFLLGEGLPSIKAGEFYSFRPYNYGPFDPCVYSDAEQLAATRFLDPVQVGAHRGYRVTLKGMEAAKRLAEQHPAAARYAVKLRHWANRLDFVTLLKAIYDKWPQYKANSVFFG
jgi:hypothetical protein